MKRNTSVILSAGAVLVLIAGMHWCMEHTAVRFYQQALERAKTEETVEAGGARYAVTDGRVTRDGRAVSGREALIPLRLAYAATVARRAPPYAIAGTDTSVLRTQTLRVQEGALQLAALQSRPRDTRDVSVLYPLRFLFALADAEDARRSFLAAPTTERLQTYEQALVRVQSAKSADLAQFASIFERVLGTSSIRLASPNGTLTPRSMRATVAAARREVSAAGARMRQQLACLHGYTQVCTPLPSIPLPDTPEPQQMTGAARALVADISSHVKSMRSVGAAPGIRVVLADSVCLRGVPGPYALEIHTTPTVSPPLTFLLYINDLFFIPTDLPNAPVLNYERDQLHMQYSPYGLLQYYSCPRIGVDMSNALAVMHIAVFAENHPDIAPEIRTKLLHDPDGLTQWAAMEYLQQALRDTAAQRPYTDAMRALEELALAATNGTYGIEHVLASIAKVSASDVHIAKEGVLFDLTPRTLFLTHSAFPTLYQIGNRADASPLLWHTIGAADRTAFPPEAVFYSAIRGTEAGDQALKDIGSFLSLENLR